MARCVPWLSWQPERRVQHSLTSRGFLRARQRVAVSYHLSADISRSSANSAGAATASTAAPAHHRRRATGTSRPLFLIRASAGGAGTHAAHPSWLVPESVFVDGADTLAESAWQGRVFSPNIAVIAVLVSLVSRATRGRCRWFGPRPPAGAVLHVHQGVVRPGQCGNRRLRRPRGVASPVRDRECLDLGNRLRSAPRATRASRFDRA